MAVIKLGSLISDIAGTVGNVTFRRTKGGHVAQVKSSGGAINTLLRNPRLGALGSLIKSWSFLDQVTRDKWKTEALNYQFPDKFGQMRNLSGRNFYFKLQGSLNVVASQDVDVDNLSSSLPLVVIDQVNYLFNDTKIITFNSLSNFGYTLIQVQRIHNDSISPSFTRREIIGVFDNRIVTKFDITTAFSNKFPTAKVGDLFYTYITEMNDSGFRSVPIVLKNSIYEAATGYQLTFNPALQDYIDMGSNNQAGSWRLGFNITINSVSVNTPFIFGGNTIFSVRADAGINWKGETIPIQFGPSGIIPFNTKIFLEIKVELGKTNFYVDGTLIWSSSQTDNILIERFMGSTVRWCPGVIENFYIGNETWPCNEGVGATITGNFSTTGTLTTLGNVNDMWSLI